MKPLPAYFAIIVLLIGGFVSRECATGFLKAPEQAYQAWLVQAAIPDPIPKITLITADASGPLSAFDMALFLRAATHFSAEVAAIAAYEMRLGNEDLLRGVLARESSLGVVMGALLTDQESAPEPGPFLAVDWAQEGGLPEFRSARTDFPSERGVNFGFMNLPGTENARTVPVLARRDQQAVASFSFACLARFLAGNGIQLTPDAARGELRFSNQTWLTIQPEGTSKLLPQTYSKIARFSLADLLVAVEKSEQSTLETSEIRDAMRGGIVLLAPAPNAEEISGGTFTIGQFQALCLASLLEQLQRYQLGVWGWVIPFLWFFPWLLLSGKWSSSDQLLGLLFLTALYALASGTLAQAYGVLLPGIPALAWALAIYGVIAFRRKSARV